ncbi:MAG TPA: alpha-2-macroglobulin family protein [Pyrinomonadaceae bacterium]|nr:alpha-2-macroglobulin family protein [Pyrinomonadaceae bacterium]
MSRKWLLSLIGLAVAAVLFAPATNARFDLKVNETSTVISFEEVAPKVILSIDNGSNTALVAVVHVELLKPSNDSFGATETEVTLKGGRQKVQVVLPLKTRDLMADNERDLLWYRLHYRVIPNGPNASPVEGFISLSQITPELFELRVAAPRGVREGTMYQARVHAVHPTTDHPVKGVRIKASATLIDDITKKNLVLTDTAITDGEGYAIVKFQLPNTVVNDFGLLVEGTRGSLMATAQTDVEFAIQPDIAVSTDKSIYQPGQTLHARALVLGASNRALANRNVTLKIKDPEDAVAFSTELKTSRFGIASADWTIPESTRLGTYSLQFGTDDDHFSQSTVKISRYDLPNFVVNVKADRSYYLPGQDATVTVRGDYLFGEPVMRGHVRVVRDAERSWDYREQKYVTTEREAFKGDLGTDQTFTVRIRLSEEFKDLRDDDDYSRFEDLHFTAFITDATTNRTEQRRFDLRISKQPIHVYVMRSGDAYSESSGLPLIVYVSTFYPDGTPARCNVVVTEGELEDSEPDERPRVIERLKTNQYGVAKLSQSRPPALDGSSSLKLTFTAHDKDRRKGTNEETFEFEDQPGIRINTAKSVFAPGEQILATITTTKPSMILSLDVVHEWSVLQSQLIHLRGGRASILIPYRPEFKGRQLTLAAHAERDDDSSLVATRTIIYPHRRDLTVNVQSTAATYRPGDQARVSFKSVDAEGSSVESALGVVVVDKAVEERARTDQEQGPRYATFFDDALILSGHGASLGTVSLKTLEKLDLSKPVPPDLDLAAEILLNRYTWYSPDLTTSETYTKDHRDLFIPRIATQLEPLRAVLGNLYQKTLTYPKDESSLRSALANDGIDFDSFKDPWGMPYRPALVIKQNFDVLNLESAGADKQFDTDDDLTSTQMSWPYFRPTGEAIDKAVTSFHQRTGGFIRDYNTLRDELMPLGVNLDTLKDRWLKPYAFRFYVDGTNHVVSVTTTEPIGYEFSLWQSRLDYFAELRKKIDARLDEQARTSGFPQSRDEMREALLPAGIDLDRIYDPWGTPYYITFNTLSFFGDQVRMESRSVSNGERIQHLELKPITSVVLNAKFRSKGADAKEGTYDDFDVATFSVTRSQQSARDSQPKSPTILATFSGATGAITGTVNDPNGAVIRGATVTASAPAVSNVFTSTSNDEGRYLLRNLPAGTYELRVEAAGFKALVVTSVVVQVATVFELNVTLEPASVTETVTVSGGAVNNLVTESASLSVTKVKAVLPKVPTARPDKGQQPFSTPRLREYFPETLVWQPELITDKKGRAHVEFKLADNITTWKMSVISSTESGEIGVAETEIKTFQPFFAELEPPQVLTEGDQISLPVVVRNYLTKKQTVDLELKPENWFSMSVARKKTDVAARDSATQFFDIQATLPISNGKQRLTALGSDFSDAIEKPVTVHPDGEEKAIAVTDLFTQSVNLRFDLPNETISNSAHVELKVYPNLMSHVWESVEAILQRPYGCAEQTISSTYPSVLVLRYLKQTQQDAVVAAKARRYLQIGYQKLLGYQVADGGFTYWGRGDGDVALTSYALRFLTDASTFTDVDSNAIARAREWLLNRQRQDGSWPAISWSKAENERQTGMLTALVARSLAASSSCGANQATPTSVKTALKRSLDYLERRSNEIDEPYLIASYSLAASSACEPSRAANANNRLRKLAKQSTRAAYWVLESNTPFYGWGMAGRVETTALALQALAQQRADGIKDELIDHGLLFLMREKDRYGVWYSGQATINVLNSLLTVMPLSPQQNANDNVEIWVNNQKFNSVQLPVSRQTVGPLMVDITSVIQKGNNTIELKRATNSAAASVQIVGTYWIPWSTSPDAEVSADSKTLRLDTMCDKTAARVMETVTCRVKAERVGFRGYGMMLAEIGLPPGADVDRGSLDTALKSSNWAIDQYDVLPDRVVVYLWPRGGGSEFEFKFRPRMAMNAQSSASILYDYYNPEARVTVGPKRFVVKQ